MPKYSPETKRQQLAETEQLMVTLRMPWRVTEALIAKWHIDERTARRWMAAVRATWRAEATDQDRTTRRDDMRKTLSQILTAALTRTEVMLDANGKPMYRMNPDGTPMYDRNGTPVQATRQRPDLRAALRAANQLAALDALDEPKTVRVESSSLDSKMPPLHDLPSAARQHLEAALEALSPGGDLRKLAGGLFAGGDETN